METRSVVSNPYNLTVTQNYRVSAELARSSIYYGGEFYFYLYRLNSLSTSQNNNGTFQLWLCSRPTSDSTDLANQYQANLTPLDPGNYTKTTYFDITNHIQYPVSVNITNSNFYVKFAVADSLWKQGLLGTQTSQVEVCAASGARRYYTIVSLKTEFRKHVQVYNDSTGTFEINLSSNSFSTLVNEYNSINELTYPNEIRRIIVIHIHMPGKESYLQPDNI